ncbi:multiple C2 domain and transmembrane region protein 10 [Beta vulgaris subsp. vulgaris]|uniref:multiple C2 domain and transmembrane region protein 10 n=1 Tax=Beta vulgaris subsp. vulgaris TaxID=3555 RepID=UPI0020375F01|nr:multiple C2 domain and transmembrane region protein 10 [Beta vulgaris subsp. vulgaris]
MKEKLVVEVIGAHNLMPKDGEGSSSPFVEVEFENQRLKTQVKYKDLNPVWNEKLIFHVNDVADLPYRTLEVNVFNEKSSSNSRNFLGKVRISGINIAKQGEEMPTLYTLDKRSLFSHIRGEISLKLYYVSTKQVDHTKQVITYANNNNASNNSNSIIIGNGNSSTTAVGKGKKKGGQNAANLQVMVESGSGGGGESAKNAGELLKPVVIQNPGMIPGSGGGGGRGVMGIYPHGHVHGHGHGSNEFSLKETSPHLGGKGGGQSKDKTSSTYDLVEQMQYLYVRVVKARDLLAFGGGEVIAEVKLGNYKGVTKRVSFNHAEWDQVFAFSKDCIQSSMVEVFVKEREKDEFIGRVWFDMNEVPKRVPPDSQLAPQWHRMEDKRGDKSKSGEVMVSIWFGTQADEAFAEAWHSKAANVHLDGLCSMKSKIYLSPKLWYLRVSVIEAHDLVLGEKGSSLMRYPEFYVKVQVGNQVLRTKVSNAGTTRAISNPFWNEDLIFVVPEPFEDYLLISVEDRLMPGREEVVGRLLLPLAAIERRWDDKTVPSKWFHIDNHIHNPAFSNPSDPSKNRFGSRIHIRASMDGGYHVLDEATMYSSDLRPTAKQLWKPHIGVLEMGILGATGLMPMKIREGKGGTTDAYCVAKYGQKWVRTRTVVDSLSPKWNEQYTWEVFDPCTVITVGVFDNCRIDKNIAAATGARDSRIGKVRIRLSTLETDRVYTHSYPLLVLHASGVKKTGELHLAVRFSCENVGNMLHTYAMPLLPKMHYVHPLSVNQLESLRYQAMHVVTARFSRAEPSLGREVVEYMLDHDSHMWSMRKSKANFFRLMNVLSGFIGLAHWAEAIRAWQRPVYSSLFVVVFLLLVTFPELIIPTMLIYMALIGIWRYRSRPRHPPHMDTRLSHAENVFPDELDEEFDSFPSIRSSELVRMRYDRLRSMAGRIQTVVGDMATQGERFQALLSWRDPRATFLFVILCLFAAIGFYVVPMKVVVALWGIYYLRPPRFRSKLPAQVFSFFRRLPSKADSLL